MCGWGWSCGVRRGAPGESDMPVTSLSSDQGENLGSSFGVKITPLLGADSKVPAPESCVRHTVRRLCSALGQGPTRHICPRSRQACGPPALEAAAQRPIPARPRSCLSSPLRTALLPSGPAAPAGLCSTYSPVLSSRSPQCRREACPRSGFLHSPSRARSQASDEASSSHGQMRG